MTAQPEVTAADLLAAKFPDWSIWRSDKGRWWATRRTPLSKAEEQQPGVDRMVDADTPANLDKLLSDQAKRTGKAAAP